jgi:hypothetical protein
MKIDKFACFLVLAFSLTGCNHLKEQPDVTAHNFSGNVYVYNEYRPVKSLAQNMNDLSPASGSGVYGLSAAGKKNNCRLKDRFDRKMLIAYNFSDQKSRLGLKMDVDGFSLSDAGNFDVQEIRVNYRYRFQPIKKRKERCLFQSPWQGIIGSGYNEFYLREEDTVLDQIDDEIDDIEDKIEQIF